MTDGFPELVDVHLIGIPVALWLTSQEHFQDLMREFALISSAERDAAADPAAHRHAVPHRLLDLVDALMAEYGQLNTRQEEELAAAAEAGLGSLDLVYQVPPQAAQAAIELGKLMDEADEYCRQGEHLLTLATAPTNLAYRHWYIAQFVDQLAGKEAVPWPRWQEENSVTS